MDPSLYPHPEIIKRQSPAQTIMKALFGNGRNNFSVKIIFNFIYFQSVTSAIGGKLVAIGSKTSMVNFIPLRLSASARDSFIVPTLMLHPKSRF
ncbi:MAG: hypothetical protein JW774_05060 [Candidatus Aureabacteria bacterium]|nr:hypothetical protein [Candidatus Auribacterota bacterium]